MASIIYNATNCTLSGPSSANSGQSVSVGVTPVNNATVDATMITVIKNGVNIPFSFNGSTLMFFMP